MNGLLRIGRVVALALLSVAPAGARAADVVAGSLVIHQPWARATPKGAEVGGGYLRVTNNGTVADRLVGGSLDSATSFALHATSTEGGVMRMRPIGALEIPAGASVTLAPGGRHIMFTGLRRPLVRGEAVAGTLVFAHAGTVPVSFAVEGIGVDAPGPDAPAHAMPGMTMD